MTWSVNLVRAAVNAQGALVSALCGPSRALNRDDARVVLVYRSGRLGDFVNAIPALAVLRQRCPGSRIVLLTTASTNVRMQGVTSTYAADRCALPWVGLVSPSLVDEVLPVHFDSLAQAIHATRDRLRGVKPDFAIVLPNSGECLSSRVKKIVFLRTIGVGGRIVGLRMRSTYRWFRGAQSRAGMYEHEAKACLAAIGEWRSSEAENVDEEADTAVAAWRRRCFGPSGERNALLSLLPHGDGRTLVVVSPGGLWEHKRWPIEAFASLCRRLVTRPDLHLVIVGTESEAHIGNELAERLGTSRAANLVGRLSVQQLAMLCSLSSLFVGNDSGPAHVAAMAGCRVVTIMSGIEYPGHWEPWRNEKFAIRADIGCPPCFSFEKCPLGTNECITRVEVDEVLAACTTALAGC